MAPNTICLHLFIFISCIIQSIYSIEASYDSNVTKIISANNISDCINYCLRSKQCVFISYHHINSTCYIHDSQSTPSPSSIIWHKNKTTKYSLINTTITQSILTTTYNHSVNSWVIHKYINRYHIIVIHHTISHSL